MAPTSTSIKTDDDDDDGNNGGGDDATIVALDTTAAPSPAAADSVPVATGEASGVHVQVETADADDGAVAINEVQVSVKNDEHGDATADADAEASSASNQPNNNNDATDVNDNENAADDNNNDNAAALSEREAAALESELPEKEEKGAAAVAGSAKQIDIHVAAPLTLTASDDDGGSGKEGTDNAKPESSVAAASSQQNNDDDASTSSNDDDDDGDNEDKDKDKYKVAKPKTNSNNTKVPILVHDPKATDSDKKMTTPATATSTSPFPGCSCRKSACVLLYCPCFGNGKPCHPTCKCLNCKNPQGINANSKETLEERRKAKKKEKNRKKEAKKALAEAKKQMLMAEEGNENYNYNYKQKQQLLMLTVSPGRLGLTLVIVPEGGAKITFVDPACTFRGQIEPGDRVVSIDGKKVEKLEDVTVGKERVRQFGIVKKKDNKVVGNVGMVGIAQQQQQHVAAAAVIDGTPIPGVHNNNLLGASSSSNNNNAPIAARKGPAIAVSEQPIAPSGGPRKQTFPYLSELGATAGGSDRHAEHKREDIMTELLQWDKKNKVNTTAKMGPTRYQILCVPLKRRDTVNKRELDNQCFHQYNKQTKVFDKFLSAWASYCDGTDEDAANMILFNLAKRFPQCYVKNFEMANKKNDKMNGVTGNGQPPVELPPNFVSYDGTNDIKWNTRYAELFKYKEENGDCKVYSKTDLGRWVCSQRSARVTKAKSLSPKRIQLLDDLGFLWSGLPEGWARPIPGGDPRQNRAIAAKIMYPNLTIREVLYLGGFSEDELNAVKDQKHTWRTGYVYMKDIIVKKVENYENARRSGARLQIEALVNTLQSEEEDRLEKVFGEACHLLPEFLENAEERKRNGVVEKPIKSRSSGGEKNKRRRNSEDAFLDPMLDHDEPMKKHSRQSDDDIGQGIDVGERQEQQQNMPAVTVPVADNAVEFQSQMNYDHHIANAQQVARDLHSWRQQSNYWR